LKLAQQAKIVGDTLERTISKFDALIARLKAAEEEEEEEESDEEYEEKV
jgi:hypothetical protein